MANVIDVKTLSNAEVSSLIKNLVIEKRITRELLVEIVENTEPKNEKVEMAEIDALIKKHFEEYDEVFRRLA